MCIRDRTRSAPSTSERRSQEGRGRERIRAERAGCIGRCGRGAPPPTNEQRSQEGRDKGRIRAERAGGDGRRKQGAPPPDQRTALAGGPRQRTHPSGAGGRSLRRVGTAGGQFGAACDDSGLLSPAMHGRDPQSEPKYRKMAIAPRRIIPELCSEQIGRKPLHCYCLCVKSSFPAERAFLCNVFLLPLHTSKSTRT